MNPHISNILVVTNGCEENRPALQIGVWLAKSLGASVDLLGIAEPSDLHHPVQKLLEETALRLVEAGIPHEINLVKGHAEDALRDISLTSKHDLMLLGQLGRPPLRRWLMGRSFRHIIAEVTTPILYVPAARWPIQRVLVCIGGLGYALTVENFGIQVAGATGANLTLLHVVPPIDLDYPIAREIQNNWEHLVDTDTLPGKTLRQAVEIAQKLGVKTTIKVLHGIIVEEILKEIKTGEYDLVCMGSPYSSHGLRYLYTPNVTAEVAEHAHVPILTARFADPTTRE